MACHPLIFANVHVAGAVADVLFHIILEFECRIRKTARCVQKSLRAEDGRHEPYEYEEAGDW
jgi:hypothetical protein